MGPTAVAVILSCRGGIIGHISFDISHLSFLVIFSNAIELF